MHALQLRDLLSRDVYNMLPARCMPMVPLRFGTCLSVNLIYYCKWYLIYSTEVLGTHL